MLHFEGEHVAVHEVPVGEAFGSDRELDNFFLETCITALVVKAVFASDLVSNGSNEHSDILIQKRRISRRNIRSCYEVFSFVDRIAYRAFTVPDESYAVAFLD